MATTQDGQIIKASKGVEKIQTWLNGLLASNQLRLAVPDKQAPERLARVFVTEVQRNPDLISCDPKKLLSCFIQTAQLGLEVGSHLGHAWIIPYKGVPTLILGYKGILQLVYRAGMIDDISAEVVREGDLFEYELGSNAYCKHRKLRGETKMEDRPITHAYSVTWLNGATRPKIMVMTEEELLRVKRLSPAGTKPTSPWNTHPAEMRIKTVIKRQCKTLPQAIGSDAARRLQAAVTIDDQGEGAVPQAFDFQLPEDVGSPWDKKELTPDQQEENLRSNLDMLEADGLTL